MKSTDATSLAGSTLADHVSAGPRCAPSGIEDVTVSADEALGEAGPALARDDDEEHPADVASTHATARAGPIARRRVTCILILDRLLAGVVASCFVVARPGDQLTGGQDPG